MHAEARARDALAFTPLPESRWVTVDDKGILISVRYSELLSRLLRGLPNGRWDAERRYWRYPFASAEAIRERIQEIDRLAHLAHDAASEETRRREAKQAELARQREVDRLERKRRQMMSAPRPLQEAYLHSVPGRPRYPLALESIGDDTRRTLGMRRRCQVTYLFGWDGNTTWVGASLAGQADYAKANSIGSRGIMYHYLLEEGPIYLIESPQSWKSSETYFLRIHNGVQTRMTVGEVEQCLAR